MNFDDNTRSLFNSITEGKMSSEDMRIYVEMGLVSKKDFDEIVALSKHPQLMQVKMYKDTNNQNALRNLFRADPKTKIIYKLLCD